MLKYALFFEFKLQSLFLLMYFFIFDSGLTQTQTNYVNGNFQEKRISADSDYGHQSSGKMTVDFY